MIIASFAIFSDGVSPGNSTSAKSIPWLGIFPTADLRVVIPEILRSCFYPSYF